MSKFKIGDEVIAKNDAPYFRTNNRLKNPLKVVEIYEDSGLVIAVEISKEDQQFLNLNSTVYSVKSVYFELAQQTINEREMRKLLGVSDEI